MLMCVLKVSIDFDSSHLMYIKVWACTQPPRVLKKLPGLTCEDSMECTGLPEAVLSPAGSKVSFDKIRRMAKALILHDTFSFCKHLQDAEQPWDKAMQVQLCYEFKTFLLAGHETSAAMLTWTLFELSQSPEKLARVCLFPHFLTVELLACEDYIFMCAVLSRTF